MRLNHRGYKRSPSTGWSSPAVVKGRSPEGLIPVVVATVAELESYDVKQHGLVIRATLGTKKRELLVTEAQKRNFTLLNVKDADAFLKQIADKISSRKTKKVSRDKKKAEKKKKAEIKKEKSIEEKVLTPEEKKKVEEAEKQKILAHKE